MVRRRVRRLGIEATAKERDQETIRVVNNALDVSQPDPAQLRKIAAIRGLVNNEVRARAWPALLGVTPEEAAEVDDQTYEQLATGCHRDSSVVKCDVARSLWSFTEGWSDEERDEKRGALHRLLTACVCAHPPGEVHYYQGLHDIASVLLLVLGERQAFLCMRRLVKAHLRDCTRPGMEPVLELLGLLLPVLEQVDPELHQILDEMALPPVYALPWVITLFAHNVHGLAPLSRLFDLFLSSHPLMPVYASALVMKGARNQILRHCRDPSQVHSLLMRLDPLSSWGADDLAQQAVALFKHAPPAVLVRVKRVPMHCAALCGSYLENDVWKVPNKPYLPGRKPNMFGQQLLRAWETLNPVQQQQLRGAAAGGGGNGKARFNSAQSAVMAVTAAMGIPAVVMVMAAVLMQSDKLGLLR